MKSPKSIFFYFLLFPCCLVAQTLSLPPRPAGALTGDQFVSLVTSMTLTDRENEIYAQVMSGNVPGFQRDLVPVTNTETIGTTAYTYTYYVLPDYLAIGCDTNYFLCPMTPLLAQRIADATGCTMPTRKMVNQIWAAATVHLSPSTIEPSPQMTTIPVMDQHNTTVWGQRSAVLGTHPLGELVGGDKKDVVISNIIYGYPSPGRVVIYGWHYTSGTPIQPLYNGHEETYADYSHGIRLVQLNMLVNGTPATVSSVLQSSTLNSLLSDEGNIAVPRYPVNLPTLAVPVSFALLPESNTSLQLLATAQPDVTHFFVQTSNDGLNFSFTIKLHKDSLLITGQMPDIPVYIKIAAISNYDTSAYSEVLGAVPGLCKPTVLIVNGFDRTSAGNTYNFVRQHGQAFYSNGYNFVSATNEAVLNGLVVVDSFKVIDYILGVESSVNESFSTAEQTLVADYLIQGGALFVSGAEIGWDLDHLGSSADKDFYHNYLKAAYTNDAPNGQSGVYYQAQPSSSSIFAGSGPFYYDDGTHGTYNVNYPDVITQQGGSAACLEYSGLTTNYAGVCYSGLFPGGSRPGKLINMGIPFETIYPESTRNNLMHYILNYFDIAPSGMDLPVITQSNDTLYSDWSGLQQWYYNDNPVPGATGPFVVAGLAGEYFVIAENGFCYSDTSDVAQITLSGIPEEKTAAVNARVFPNPCNDQLHIEISSSPDISCMITLFNAKGQIVISQQAVAVTDLFLHNLPSGIYILTVKSSMSVYRERIIKF
ncbi:MAG TPA: T9SS type A sorting domain-containing protein [Bacteroidales bacterium]|nr:T9SS type A sorting domain-containing protein [Bacteroidales bacterium]